jgi:hypothetical protein
VIPAIRNRFHGLRLVAATPNPLEKQNRRFRLNRQIARRAFPLNAINRHYSSASCAFEQLLGNKSHIRNEGGAENALTKSRPSHKVRFDGFYSLITRRRLFP